MTNTDRPGAPSAEAERRRSSLPLPPATMVGLLLAGLAALVIAYVSMASSDSRMDAVRQFTRTLELIERLEVVSSTMKDAETGQRGFLLTGDEAYLEPYNAARARHAKELKDIRQWLLFPDGPQAKLLSEIEQVVETKFAELEETIALQRAGRPAEAMAIVRSDRGQRIMDRFRTLSSAFEREERRRFEASRQQWEGVARDANAITWAGTALLLLLIAAAGWLTSRDYRHRERLAWVRTGESQLGARIQGAQVLEKLGEEVLSFLASYLDAKVGAVYIRGEDNLYRRVAGHALSGTALAETLRPGEGLIGQAAKVGHPVRISSVPDGYLPLASGTGRGNPRELLIAPAVVDGDVQGVVEVGLLRKVDAADLELLDRVARGFAVALRSARDRERREALLEETQRQAEELQAQQEELRVANEELEEQGRALREGQARLENQHAELEQTNVQLEEQTQRLERQKQELMLAQKALHENAESLERSSRYKSEFLANMSHELRTPLNSSLILAKLLADNGNGNLDEEQVRFARTIHASNNDLLTLINDILDLSKIESGQVEMLPEPVMIDEIIESMRRTFDPIASQKKVAFHTQRAPGTAAKIITDNQRLQQVLKNLLSNAFKFTAKGEVALRIAQLANGRIAFSVRDTGIGIAPHQQEVIFEAFRQADGTTSREYGGTGLGLSISRELARLLGGQIRLESVPGQGSTFTLEVPPELGGRVMPAPQPAAVGAGDAAAPKPSPKPRAIAPAAPGASSGPHIDDDRSQRKRRDRLVLVVEDDQKFARVLYDLAHELDFDCVHCSTASEGLEMARRLKPSGILLDVSLPDGSGLTVLEQMKRDPAVRHIPVHMVSVEDHVQAAMGLGAIGYAMKPVARDDLVKAMGRLEERLKKRVSRVLVVEDDAQLRASIAELLKGESVEIVTVGTVREALEQVAAGDFDCLVTDLQLPDATGYELMEKLAEGGGHPFLPVIVYTGRALTRDEETRLRRYSKSIIIKGARSPERLLDEVTLFLHRVEASLPADQQNLLRRVRQRDEVFEGRTILLAEDDVRNIFALSRVLEPLGAQVEIARNGREAVDRMKKGGVDLVLMDIMMPVMDGLAAIREIRAMPPADGGKVPVIAITAKAMPEDRRACLDAGANDYIAKPIDIERLVSQCRVWMPR
jgi:CheY-like chemotaxis protein/CHASE3 domain sensor protein